jgi:uncharacterized membrane protein
VISTKALRRRFDYQLLRWQARLDGEWADQVMPAAAFVGLFALFVLLSLAEARSLENGVELARWVQGAYYVTNGHDAQLSVDGYHLFERHGAFGYYLLAQGTRLVAAVPYLLIIQAGALAAGVVPIWRLCRKVCSLRAGAAAAAVIAYALYPPLHQLNLADFSPEALAVPALLGAAYAGFRAHWWWAAACCVVAMSMRSDLGLVVAAIGVVLLIDTRSRQAPRMIVAGLVWTLVSALVIQPWFGDGSFVHAEAFAGYGSTVPGILWGMITDPLSVLGDLVARENFAVMVAVFAPVAFLPFLAPRYLFPAIPVLVVIFVADIPVLGPEGAANTVTMIVFVFLALPFALARLGRRNIERITVDRRILGALVLAAGVFFVHDSPSSPYEEPWAWGGRSLVDQARLDAIELLESPLAVRGTDPVVPDLAWRRQLYVIDPDATSADDLTDGVDAVLIDDTVYGDWPRSRYEGLLRAIEGEGFEVALDRYGVVLLVRVEDPDDND